jgi:hypothetical protein
LRLLFDETFAAGEARPEWLQKLPDREAVDD